MSWAQRLVSPVVDARKEEAGVLLLMFLYSFLVMTSYNIVKPLTRAQFIDELGADNLPWVLLVSGVLVGVAMHFYGRGVARLPPRSVLATTQIVLAGMLFGFWALFQIEVAGVSVAFYLVGQILGLLLISQFWMLANDIYDARQAKRLFGFIGGGASLGGMTGSALVAFAVERVGTNGLLLISGAVLLACAGIVTRIAQRSQTLSAVTTPRARGVGAREALVMLRRSRHLQLIALIIGFAAIGAGLLEQQLNMAVEDAQGDEGSSGIAAFLGQVQLYLSITGFVIQIWLTTHIHRYLGIGFAMLILPVGLGATGVLIVATGALWAAAAGKIIDSSLRYTVDKTTREILFLPLPFEMKQEVKPFIDVTVDRFAKGVGAAVTLVLIQPWGFNLSWHQLSWVSFAVSACWVAAAVAARRQYLRSLRRSIAQRGVEPTEVRVRVADLSTVEALVEELAHPDEERVLYAIDVLESLEKRHLVTPLLLHHESAAVRARALLALGTVRADIAQRLVPLVERLVTDQSPQVRSAAVGALARIREENAEAVARSLLTDPDPQILVTAAVVLAGSEDIADRQTAARTLAMLASDFGAGNSTVRRDLAAAIREVGDAATHDLLVPLLHDLDPDVAEEAMRSVRALETTPLLFAPTLVSLLGKRRLKSGARQTLVHFGEPIVDVLRYFLQDQEESVWVRRHIPATLARIPCQTSMDTLVASLEDDDGFLRFKALAAIEKLRREHPTLRLRPGPIEQRTTLEVQAYYRRLIQHHNLFERAGVPATAVLAQALEEKLERSVDRIYRLLGLLYPWKDVTAARRAIERGDSRVRAEALEHLDHLLSGQFRSSVIPVLEHVPTEERVKRGHSILRTRPRGVEETLLDLINDEDEVVAAAAIDLVGSLQLPSLRDDVEHILAHRDSADWHVFAAASWTLAAFDLTPEGRRDRWLEPLPATVVVDRMRGLPLFASVGIDELFRIAGVGRQTRHQPGAVLFREGSHPDGVHVLLDGNVVAIGHRSGTRKVEAVAALAFEETLDGHRMAETIRTSSPAVTLALSTDELGTLLADNTDLVQGLFRTLVDRHVTRAGLLSTHPFAPTEPLAGEQLSPVQKGLALRRVPLFAKVTAEEMMHLAAIADPVHLDIGDPVADQTAPLYLAIVLSGGLQSLVSERHREVVEAHPGDVIGVYEIFATPSTTLDPRDFVANAPSTVLRVERDDLFDLLGQRPDLLQQIFAAMFARRHDAGAAGPPQGLAAMTTLASSSGD